MAQICVTIIGKLEKCGMEGKETYFFSNAINNIFYNFTLVS